MTFAVIGGLAGAAAGAAGLGGLTLATGAGLGLAAGSALGSLTGTDAASRAADVQSAAADRAAAGQERMFERQVQLSEPWRQSGIAAQNQLLTLLGIAPQGAAPSTGGGGGFGILGGIANQIQQSGALGPRLQVDTTSPEFGKYAKDFGMAQFQADPGYGFRMSEGMKALERSAAARGGLLSGATLKGVQRFSQDLGSQEYMNAFNRYQTERAARLNPLQSLAGVGQTTAQQIGEAGMRTAQNVGETLTSGAAARASGYVGSANALTGALGNYLNYQQGQNILNALRAPTVMPTAAPTYPSYQVPYTANIG